MATLTIDVPEDFKVDLEKHNLINWSAVARDAIWQKLSQLRLLEAITAKSKLTEEEALELGRKINRSMHARFKKEHPEAYA